MHLSIVLLLLAIVSTTTAPVTYIESEKAFVTIINRDRAEVADKNNIGNMHELKFDEDLYRTAHAIANCNHKDGNFEIVKISEMSKILSDPVDLSKFLHPMQTSMACAGPFSTCTEYNEKICLLGPHKHFSVSHVVHGKIGSKCSHGTVKSGLCKENPSASSAPGQSGQNGKSMKENGPEPIETNSTNPENDSSIQKSSLITFALTIIMTLF
ncbi:unnamed protein product [Caenorhabditis nigoni]